MPRKCRSPLLICGHMQVYRDEYYCPYNECILNNEENNNISKWEESKSFGFDCVKGFYCKSCKGSLTTKTPYCPWCGKLMNNC